MATIITRETGATAKGSPLTNLELDNNFINLNTELGQKLPLAGGTMTGVITFAAGQTWPTFNQNTTGSAATLTTARTINGVSFNGSANITVTANTTNALTINNGLSGTLFNGSSAVSIGLATAYGDTVNPYASKTAKTFLAAPNVDNGVPSFRAIVASDIPTLNQNTTGTANNVTGIVAITNGGTGAITVAQAQTNLQVDPSGTAIAMAIALG